MSISTTKKKKIKVIRNVSDLRRHKWSNVASSVRVFLIKKVIKPLPKPKIIPKIIPRPKPRIGCIIAFAHRNYAGKWMRVCGSVPNFVKVHWNDKTTSIRVPFLTYAIIYQHINYKGKAKKITHNIPHLKKIGFDNMTSSIRVFRIKPAPKPLPKPTIKPKPHVVQPKFPGKGCVMMFEHINFRGRWLRTCGSIPNFVKYKYNDILSSVKVGPLTKVILFEDINYKGKHITLLKNVPNLVRLKWNDKASSLRVFLYKKIIIKPIPKPIKPVIIIKPAPRRPRNGCIIMFQHINYRGKWAHTCGSMPNFVKYHFNDILSSVKVGRFTKAVFYEHINYKGKHLILTRDAPNLVRNKWNDKASSVRLFKFVIKPGVKPKPAPKPKKKPVPHKPVPKRPKSGCILAFEHINFRGMWIHICGSIPNFPNSNGMIRFHQSRLVY